MESSGSVMQGARSRARGDITNEILRVAKRHLVEGGAAGLSLRAVARDVGMVSSAIYRYFASRDELLTRLIIDAFNDVADAVEAADGSKRRSDIRGRFVACGSAIRAWAIAHPHEYALIYGTPVPGYVAPQDTIGPVNRGAKAFVELLRDAVAAGQVVMQPGSVPRRVKSALRPISVAFDGIDEVNTADGLYAWISIFGMVNFEVFGHLHNVVEDPEAFFEYELHQMASRMFSS